MWKEESYRRYCAFVDTLGYKALGLTQDDLEIRGGIDRSFLSRVERGESQICLRHILHLLTALNLTPDELIGEVLQRTQTKPTSFAGPIPPPK